jgi:hypothetical protein
MRRGSGGLFFWWAGSIAALAITGCAGGDAPDVVPVTGVATRNGQPIPSVTLCFQPASGRPSLGECDAQGKFKLRYTREQDGAKIGTHTVYVLYSTEASPGPAPKDIKAITDKYGTPEISPLKIEIKKREDNLEVRLD